MRRFTFIREITFLICSTIVVANVYAATYTVPGRVGIVADKCIWKNVEGLKDKATGQVTSHCLRGEVYNKSRITRPMNKDPYLCCPRSATGPTNLQVNASNELNSGDCVIVEEAGVGKFKAEDFCNVQLTGKVVEHEGIPFVPAPLPPRTPASTPPPARPAPVAVTPAPRPVTPPPASPKAEGVRKREDGTVVAAPAEATGVRERSPSPTPEVRPPTPAMSTEGTRQRDDESADEDEGEQADAPYAGRRLTKDEEDRMRETAVAGDLTAEEFTPAHLRPSAMGAAEQRALTTIRSDKFTKKAKVGTVGTSTPPSVSRESKKGPRVVHYIITDDMGFPGANRWPLPGFKAGGILAGLRSSKNGVDNDKFIDLALLLKTFNRTLHGTSHQARAAHAQVVVLVSKAGERGFPALIKTLSDADLENGRIIARDVLVGVNKSFFNVRRAMRLSDKPYALGALVSVANISKTKTPNKVSKTLKFFLDYTTNAEFRRKTDEALIQIYGPFADSLFGLSVSAPFVTDWKEEFKKLSGNPGVQFDLD